MMDKQYLPISTPQKGAGGQTGSWRNIRPNLHKEKCIGCLMCYILCPEACFDKETLAIDYNYCKGCGVCAQECPKKAIDMEREA